MTKIPDTAKLIDDWFMVLDVVEIFSLAFGRSRTDIKRVLKQGGCRVNGESVKDLRFTFHEGDVLRMGHKMVQLKLPRRLTKYEDDDYIYVKVEEVKT